MPFYVDTSALVKLVGADRMTLGSDYCFDMGLTDPLATTARIEGLTDAERGMINGGTAARLLHLV